MKEMAMTQGPGRLGKPSARAPENGGDRLHVEKANDRKLPIDPQRKAAALKVLDQAGFPKEVAKIVVEGYMPEPTMEQHLKWALEVQVKDAQILSSKAKIDGSWILVGGNRAKVTAIDGDKVTVVAKKDRMLQRRAVSSERLRPLEWKYQFDLVRTADLFKPAG
jgi:hypothetical protein